MTAGGALTISPDALMVKLIGLPDVDVLLWRGLLTAIGFAAIVWLRKGRGFWHAYRRCGWTGVGVAFFFACSTCGFVLGNQYTKGGNVLMILAGAPLMAALLSRVFLHERLPLRTWAAIFACMAGIAMIVLDDAGGGSWVGNAFALMAATAMGCNFTLSRTKSGVDMSPMLALSGLMVAVAAFFASGFGAGFSAPSAASWLWLVILCLGILPLGFTFIQRGPLYLPAAEVGLLMLAEVVAGTVWVWLVLGEEPAPTALAGGALVIGTLVGKGLYERRLEMRQRRYLADLGLTPGEVNEE